MSTHNESTSDPTPTAAIYDVVIVGAGMFGASAARHVRRLRPRHTLAVVGPADNASALARGQHHDVARITRVADPLGYQAMLNYVALGGYADTAAAARAAEEEEEKKEEEERKNKSLKKEAQRHPPDTSSDHQHDGNCHNDHKGSSGGEGGGDDDDDMEELRRAVRWRNSDFYTPCGMVWAMDGETREATRAALSLLPPRCGEMLPATAAAAAGGGGASAVGAAGGLTNDPHRADGNSNDEADTTRESLLTAEEARGRMQFVSDAAQAESIFSGEVNLRRLPPSSTHGSNHTDVFFVEKPGTDFSLLPLDGNTTRDSNNNNNGSGSNTDARMPLAGTVDPARYVAAQLSAAAAAAPREAFTRVVAVVTAVKVCSKSTNSNNNNDSSNNNNRSNNKSDGSNKEEKSASPALIELTLDDGRTIRGRRVLVATACFAQYLSLLPSRRLARATAPVAEFVVLLRVSPPHAEGTVEGVSDVARFVTGSGDDTEADSGDEKGNRKNDNDNTNTNINNTDDKAAAARALAQHMRHHLQNVEASRRVPCVVLTRGPLEGQFYSLPPRYYPDRAGWFIKMGSTNHNYVDPSDTASGNANTNRDDKDGDDSVQENNDEPLPNPHHSSVSKAEAAALAAARAKVFDFSVDTHAKAMAWYRGDRTLPRCITSVFEKQLEGLYPGWRVLPEQPWEREEEEEEEEREKKEKQNVSGGAAAAAAEGSAVGGDAPSATSSSSSSPTTITTTRRLRNRYIVRCIWDMTRSGAPIIDRVQPDDDGSVEEDKEEENKDATSGEEKGVQHNANSNNNNSRRKSTADADDDAKNNSKASLADLYCAIGGNGRGAKNCDTIGEVAAHRVLGEPLPPRLAAFDGMFRLQQEEGVSW